MSSGPWSEHLSRRLAALKAAGLQRSLHIAEGCGARVVLGERAVVNFASNDYLGLSADPRVVAAARAALEHSGAGATASRLLGGTKPEHAALEQELARFKRS
ncbi:MAG: aminotransferase class I/II-fold pyridoxal phosphate-dependent enzyme, partial [Planctomycetota bacterium]|nr:aminotransferase class I/II-fold pyridoxal phosphate-dependent enzyme [Planctomycetota bacterium]